MTDQAQFSLGLEDEDVDPEKIAREAIQFRLDTWKRLQRIIVGITREDEGGVIIEKVYGPVAQIDPKFLLADIAASQMLLTVLMKVFTVIFPPPTATGASDETDPTRKQEGEDNDRGGVAE